MQTDLVTEIIKELKESLENGDRLKSMTAKRLSRMQLIIMLDTHQGVEKINGRLKKVEAAADETKRYPSLLWLLRYKTKQTVSVLVAVFLLLSALYVSGVREPILDFLGLPSLIP